jgi:predicted transcriptional regulator
MDQPMPWPTQNVAHVASGRRQRRINPRRRSVKQPPAEVPTLVKSSLGRLEQEVLNVVCRIGESSARQVLKQMPHPLAYTTVMTTMARLYRKGLLSRRVSGKSFLYTSRLSSAQLELQFARDLLRALTRCMEIASDQLAAATVDVLHRQRPELLQELRRAIATGS